MSLFRKNIKEDRDREDENEPRKKLPKSKEFRDILSENKKTRKEPVKPWGKKERGIVFAVFGTTVLISSFLALSSRSWKLAGLPRIQLPGSDLFEEKTIIVEGNKLDEDKSQRELDVVTEETRPLTGVYGIYLIRLDDFSTFGFLEKDSFDAASLIKLPVMAKMYLEAQKGNLDLSTVYTLKDSDKVGGSGDLDKQQAGYKLTYRDLLEQMGKNSDNTAMNITVNILGQSNVDMYIKDLGMDDTSFEKNQTTPYDIGLFFKKLWQGEILSPQYKDSLMNNLTNTSFESWIAAGVPDGVQVSHKYGKGVNVINDAGIVFAQKPFVLVVLSKGVDEDKANVFIPEITGNIYSIEED